MKLFFKTTHHGISGIIPLEGGPDALKLYIWEHSRHLLVVKSTSK